MYHEMSKNVIPAALGKMESMLPLKGGQGRDTTEADRYMEIRIFSKGQREVTAFPSESRSEPSLVKSLLQNLQRDCVLEMDGSSNRFRIFYLGASLGFYDPSPTIFRWVALLCRNSRGNFELSGAF
ncbi:UNVERIFIED_CONTAM: hypothetical protein K2H54_020470 [Gekko kuhli]